VVLCSYRYAFPVYSRLYVKKMYNFQQLFLYLDTHICGTAIMLGNSIEHVTAEKALFGLLPGRLLNFGIIILKYMS